MLANSRFFTEFGLGGDYGLVSFNEIDDITLSGDFSWFKSSNSTIKFGSQVKRLGFEYTNKFNDSTQFEIKTDPIEFANYIKLKYEPNDLLIIEPGLRLNFYNVYPDSLYPDFRLGLKYILNGHIEFQNEISDFVNKCRYAEDENGDIDELGNVTIIPTSVILDIKKIVDKSQ